MSRACLRSGFTLVELAIVLVILGLLTGGILAGRSLLRSAEIRYVMTQAETYTTATRAFFEQYQYLPGDLNNATSYWGKNAASCNGDPGTASATGTCNGNGNGVVNEAAAANTTGEYFQYWNHLAQAGLIEGRYTGIAGAGDRYSSTVGVNVPASRIPASGWTACYPDIPPGDPILPARKGNAFYFGGPMAGTYAINPVLSPEEMSHIDTKLDDGLPLLGDVWTLWAADCSIVSSGQRVYNLTDSSKKCAAVFWF